MKLRSLLLVCGVMLALVVSAWASDLSGKWTAQVPGRDGQTREVSFNFKAEGEKLSGTMSAMQGEVPISDGKVSGDDVSFTVNLNFNGNEVKLLFNGKVAGDEIKFTRRRDGGNGPGQEFTAKRAK